MIKLEPNREWIEYKLDRSNPGFIYYKADLSDGTHFRRIIRDKDCSRIHAFTKGIGYFDEAHKGQLVVHYQCLGCLYEYVSIYDPEEVEGYNKECCS